MLKIKRGNETKAKVKEDKKYASFLFFYSLMNIIKKNFKLILRSKSSSLIVLLGPLIIIVLVGTAYNTSNIYDIRVGVYSSEYSELSDSVLGQLGDQQFSIKKFNSEEECISNIKTAETHVCAIIPANLQVSTQEPINFYVDQSRVNLVWIIIDALSSKVESKSSEISLQLTNSIITALDDTKNTIGQNEEQLNNIVSGNEDALTSIEEVTTSLSLINADLADSIDIGKIGRN